MNAQKFSDLLLFCHYEDVENALKEGFDPNTPLEQGKTAMEWCSYSNDYRMMEILWRYGGQAITPMTEEIISKFENGESYTGVANFYSNDQDEEINLSDLIDLTEDFSVEKLEFQKGSLWLQEESSYTIDIPVSSFILDGEVVKTSVRLDFIHLAEPPISYVGKTVEFPVNPEEGYVDGSIYLRSCHNPADLTRLKFLQLDNETLTVEISLTFDFEYEDIGFHNEELVKTIELEWK
ncbi:hypothetical protein [Chryseobacterium sp. Mn2064]|uniref:hypothetical protein n=1 Tax=Chryseobacterium sp. Mn2064 TaxID=3395263 RepID=UPI003BCC57A8